MVPTSERSCAMHAAGCDAVRNAVAKLNDMLSFDEFYLPNKGVTIPC